MGSAKKWLFLSCPPSPRLSPCLPDSRGGSAPARAAPCVRRTRTPGAASASAETPPAGSPGSGASGSGTQDSWLYTCCVVTFQWLILLYHIMKQYRESIVLVNKACFEILVEISILGSHELEKYVFTNCLSLYVCLSVCSFGEKTPTEFH